MELVRVSFLCERRKQVRRCVRGGGEAPAAGAAAGRRYEIINSMNYPLPYTTDDALAITNCSQVEINKINATNCKHFTNNSLFVSKLTVKASVRFFFHVWTYGGRCSAIHIVQ